MGPMKLKGQIGIQVGFIDTRLASKGVEQYIWLERHMNHWRKKIDSSMLTMFNRRFSKARTLDTIAEHLDNGSRIFSESMQQFLRHYTGSNFFYPLKAAVVDHFNYCFGTKFTRKGLRVCINAYDGQKVAPAWIRCDKGDGYIDACDRMVCHTETLQWERKLAL
ncbi:MAG: hypothetical protein MMC23_009995 [Stictis urceolatum]|nr:hypothetical protein [Stictis urceolata]